MVRSQAIGSQPANRVSEANGIGTQTSVADIRNRVISVQGGATNHAHTDVGVGPSQKTHTNAGTGSE
ncbi:hypothetical protein Tco_0057834 [Tanacetum coccineum]